MRKAPVGIAPAPTAFPSNTAPPLPIDRDAFDRRIIADYEETLLAPALREIAVAEIADLAWNYFVAGFAAATRSDSFEGIRGDLPGTVPSARPGQPMGGESHDPLADMVAALSSRRLEVLRLVARGLTNREIAEVLNISNSTVKSHMAAVFESLDVTNRTEAAYALQCYEEAYGAMDVR